MTNSINVPKHCSDYFKVCVEFLHVALLTCLAYKDYMSDIFNCHSSNIDCYGIKNHIVDKSCIKQENFYHWNGECWVKYIPNKNEK